MKAQHLSKVCGASTDCIYFKSEERLLGYNVFNMGLKDLIPTASIFLQYHQDL